MQSSVSFCGELVKNEEFPKYLRVTLDRTLIYREYLKRVADKLKARVNIIRKLGRSSSKNDHWLDLLMQQATEARQAMAQPRTPRDTFLGFVKNELLKIPDNVWFNYTITAHNFFQPNLL
ncbi:uncharacterized protein LOC144591345 isoform X2 [Rhinoraja longicauda]